jgi:PTS system mannose-specific IIA component
MIGVLVVTHGEFGVSLLKTVEGILGPQDKAMALALVPGMGLEDLGERLRQSIHELDGGDGVLILVDLFGGTPCNAGLALCGQPGIEVVTGVSLPVVIEALLQRAALALPELAKAVVERGKESLVHASAQLRLRMGS